MSFDEKINFATELVIKIQNSKQYIFINDNGVIVKPDGEVAWWFNKILSNINNCFVIGIASKYKVREYRSSSPFIFSVAIPELSLSERKALLHKTCQDLQLEISKDDLKIVSNVLSGFPQQVILAAKMIDEDGIKYTLDNLAIITDYSKDKAFSVMSFFEDDAKAKDFLNFLCNFDFVDTELLEKIFDDTPYLKKKFYEFLSMAICNFIGADRQYICVCNIIRDYVTRSKIGMNDYYRAFLSEYEKEIIDINWCEQVSLADYYAVIKAQLLLGNTPPMEFVLPSHYIKSIIDLYNNQKYQTVNEISKKIIENNSVSSFDNDLKREFYTYYCQSLAREHNESFFVYCDNENLLDSDKKFLLGFYYRINNNPAKAIKNLLEALELGSNSPRIKRELVNSYIIIEDYDSALSYSKDNYDSDNNNPYYIQSYFKSLIYSSDYKQNRDILDMLLVDINKVNTSTARDMSAELKALYEFRLNNDAETAFGYIESVINESDRKIYLLLSKFDIAYYASNIDVMNDVIIQIDSEVKNKPYHMNAFYIRRAKLAYKLQKSPKIIEAFLSKIKYFPESSLKRLRGQLGLP